MILIVTDFISQHLSVYDDKVDDERDYITTPERPPANSRHTRLVLSSNTRSIKFCFQLQKQQIRNGLDSPDRATPPDFVSDDQRTSNVTHLRQRRMSTQLKVRHYGFLLGMLGFMVVVVFICVKRY